jgi:hypothetical protein
MHSKPSKRKQKVRQQAPPEWSEEEDRLLRQMVATNGSGDWQRKANRFCTNRTKDAIKRRWYTLEPASQRKYASGSRGTRAAGSIQSRNPEPSKRKISDVHANAGQAWPTLWACLERDGWEKVPGDRPKDCFYLPPGVLCQPPWRRRRDYFDSTNGVRTYLAGSFSADTHKLHLHKELQALGCETLQPSRVSHRNQIKRTGRRDGREQRKGVPHPVASSIATPFLNVLLCGNRQSKSAGPAKRKYISFKDCVLQACHSCQRLCPAAPQEAPDGLVRRKGSQV